MNDTLRFDPQLAIKDKRPEYYEEFDSKDFLNNYVALSKVNPFMKVEPKSKHDVQTSNPNDITCFDVQTEIKSEQFKLEIKGEKEEYFEFDYDVKSFNHDIKLEDSHDFKITGEHYEKDMKVEKQEYFEFDVVGSNEIFKVEESVDVKDEKHENADVSYTDGQADTLVKKKLLKTSDHDVISFSFVLREGVALVNCSDCRSRNDSHIGTKISYLIHHLKKLHADRIFCRLKCEFCSTIVIDSKIVSHLEECSQIFMEIFKYENRNENEIRKELENQFKSEKRKNFELLKKGNLKSSIIPSKSVTCPLCRVTLKNLNKHYAKVHGNIPAAERLLKKKENSKSSTIPSNSANNQKQQNDTPSDNRLRQKNSGLKISQNRTLQPTPSVWSNGFVPSFQPSIHRIFREQFREKMQQAKAELDQDQPRLMGCLMISTNL